MYHYADRVFRIYNFHKRILKYTVDERANVTFFRAQQEAVFKIVKEGRQFSALP